MKLRSAAAMNIFAKSVADILKGLFRIVGESIVSPYKPQQTQPPLHRYWVSKEEIELRRQAIEAQFEDTPAMRYRIDAISKRFGLSFASLTTTAEKAALINHIFDPAAPTHVDGFLITQVSSTNPHLYDRIFGLSLSHIGYSYEQLAADLAAQKGYKGHLSKDYQGAKPPPPPKFSIRRADLSGMRYG